MQALPRILHQRAEQIANDSPAPGLDLGRHRHTWCQIDLAILHRHGALRQGHLDIWTVLFVILQYAIPSLALIELGALSLSVARQRKTSNPVRPCPHGAVEFCCRPADNHVEPDRSRSNVKWTSWMVTSIYATCV